MSTQAIRRFLLTRRTSYELNESLFALVSHQDSCSPTYPCTYSKFPRCSNEPTVEPVLIFSAPDPRSTFALIQTLQPTTTDNYL
jgi:hypothetical protein